MVLTAYLALANAIVGLARNEMELWWLITLAAMANLFVVLMWIKSLRFMIERAILHQPSRVIVQGILYPMSVVIVGILAFNLLALLSSLEVFEHGLVAGAKEYFSHPLVMAAAVSLLASTTTILALRALFCQFVTIGDAAPAQPSNESYLCLAARAAEQRDEREPE
jgi:hypothetical protein